MQHLMDFNEDAVMAVFQENIRNEADGFSICLASTQIDPTSGGASKFPRPHRELTLFDLQAGKRAYAGYISGTIVSRKPVQTVGVCIVIKAKGGEGFVMVQVYNFALPNANKTWLEAALPFGAPITIYEPYMKRYPRNVTIRVDNPQDLVIGVPPAPQNMSSNEIREQGNDLLKRGKSFEAWLKYSQAMEATQEPQESAVALANRAEACLRQRKFGAALQDATDALLVLDPSSATFPKAQLRRAKALIGMERFEKAIEQLGEIQSPSCEQMANVLLKSTKIKLHQATTGEVDWDKLIFDSTTEEQRDLPTFIGPVEISTQTTSGSRGLVTSRAVNAGDLLFIDNDLVFGECDEDAMPTTIINTGEVFTQDRFKILTKLVALCIDRPDVLDKVNTLYNGEPTANGNGLDVNRLRRVIKKNSFGMGDDYRKKTGRLRTRLFYMVSFMNHSCMPNTTIVGFGNTTYVVRAAKDIAKGEEITTTYIDLLSTSRVADRRKRLTNWDFHCMCELCRMEDKCGNSLLQLDYAVAAKLQSALTLKENAWFIQAFTAFKQVADFVNARIAAIEREKHLTSRETVLLQTRFLRVYDDVRYMAQVGGRGDDFSQAQCVCDELFTVFTPLSFQHMVSAGMGFLHRGGFRQSAKTQMEFAHLHEQRYGVKNAKRAMQETADMMMDHSLPEGDWLFRFVKPF